MKKIALLLAITALNISSLSICGEKEPKASHIPVNSLYGLNNNKQLEALNPSDQTEQVFTNMRYFENHATPAVLTEYNGGYSLYTPSKGFMPVRDLKPGHLNGLYLPNAESSGLQYETPFSVDVVAIDNHGDKYEVKKQIKMQQVELYAQKSASDSAQHYNNSTLIIDSLTQEAFISHTTQKTQSLESLGILLTPKQRKLITEKKTDEPLFMEVSEQNQLTKIYEISKIEIKKPNAFVKLCIKHPQAAKFVGAGMLLVFVAAAWRSAGILFETDWLAVLSNKIFGTNYDTALSCYK